MSPPPFGEAPESIAPPLRPSFHDPTIDAVDEMDALTTLDVELTEKQVAWLRREAEERGLSLDHVLRSVITAHLRREGNGTIRETDAGPSTSAPRRDESSRPSREDAGGPSIVDSLRSASRRLEDLTDAKRVEDVGSERTLSGLQEHLDGISPTRTPLTRRRRSRTRADPLRRCSN